MGLPPGVPYWSSTPQKHPRCDQKNYPFIIKWSGIHSRGDACFELTTDAIACAAAFDSSNGILDYEVIEVCNGRAPLGCLLLHPRWAEDASGIIKSFVPHPGTTDLATGLPCRVDSVSNVTFPTHNDPIVCAADDNNRPSTPTPTPALEGQCKECQTATPCFATPGGCSESGEREWTGAFAACETQGAAQCGDMGCFPESSCTVVGPCKACIAAKPCFATPGGCSASGEREWTGAFEACVTQGAAQCADMGCFPKSSCAISGPCKECQAAKPCFATPGGCSASGERVWTGAFAACVTQGAAQCAGCFADSLCST
jgi:hypothetical protein